MPIVGPYDEWLIFFKRGCKRFTISFFEDGIEHTVTGSYIYSRKIDCSLKMNVLAKTVALDLTWRRVLEPRSLAGSIVSPEGQTGSCVVENSHEDDSPMIRIKSKNPDYHLEAYKANPGIVSCPLEVLGLEGCELVLMTYSMLEKIRKRTLRNNRLKWYFAGRCKSVRSLAEPSEAVLNGISLVVAVNHLVVQDTFMSMC